MNENRCDKIVSCRIPRTTSTLIPLIEINEVIKEGFEVADIVPYPTSSGGAIFTVARGLYTSNVLFHLRPSDKITAVSFCSIRHDKNQEYIDKINCLILEEDKKGNKLFKIIPAVGIMEQQNGNGMGKGTYGFSLYFISQ